MGKRNQDDNGSLGCIVLIMIAIFVMPIVGLCMIAQGNKEGDEEEIIIGIVLTVIGVILWIYLAVQ